jgi:hypothetical protein
MTMASSRKIEKLTSEQEAELPRFRQRYLDIACGGDRIERDKLEAALADAYAVIGKPAPKLFIFDSPAACMLALKIFKMPPDKLLGDQLWDQLGGQLRGQLWDQLWDQLRGQLWDQLGGQLWDQLRGQLWDQLGGQLRGQLRGQLWDQLWDQLRGQLWDQLGGQNIYAGNYIYGTHDLYWLAWARFGADIGVKFTADSSHKLDVMERISTQCEWWWPYENIVVASERPCFVKWDDQRRLHCEDGPAVEYADGYALYAWHGTRLPADWVENRKSIDPTIILKCENVEQRAAGSACVGWPRMLTALKYKTIDHDPDPSHGELIELKLSGLPNPGRFLKAECPRNGTIVEGVPSNIKTVLEAQAWRVGLMPSEFSYPSVRT